MNISYKTYRNNVSAVEFHGKPAIESVYLCFTCAVKAILNDECVESIITKDEHYCEDCGG